MLASQVRGKNWVLDNAVARATKWEILAKDGGSLNFAYKTLNLRSCTATIMHNFEIRPAAFF